MPSASTERRWSSSSNTKEKFPDFDGSTSGEYPATYDEKNEGAITSSRSPSPAKINGTPHNERWQPRKDNHLAWGNGHINLAPPLQNRRQRSLSDAFKTIRSRKASVSENAHEIAEALKAPISFKIIILCLVWYLSSALTNTSSKSILNAFPKPITLTIIQFAFVSGWCLFFAYLATLFPGLKTRIPALKNGIRYPSSDVISTTLPLALFQIGGHILSSTATEKIPVSLVHTIKGLSPLFTVLAYRFIYHIRYPTATYLSLVPLTLGVVLACSVEFSGNLFGILCAFGGALIFVTQNIFSKKLFNAEAQAESDGPASTTTPKKLDKLNLLCYCSGLAFVLTFPIWLWTDALPLYSAPLSLTAHTTPSPAPSSSLYLPAEFFFNGIFHFAQNMLAFILLSLVSPVTYSVASLIKRVFVIVIAIVWFGNSTTSIQAIGIALTFFGLYLYDRTSDSAKADRRAKLESMRIDRPLLPLSSRDTIVEESPPMSGALNTTYVNVFGDPTGYGNDKRVDSAGPGSARSHTDSPWLPPGTKQEETWRPADLVRNPSGIKSP
ncbi:solute carrier family 35, member E1, partial [Lecanoromycetidae sp. Uapishka_2]